jgi:uncharacterized protein (DUF1800 family)
MKRFRLAGRLSSPGFLLGLCATLTLAAAAQTPLAPDITSVNVVNGRPTLEFQPAPATDEYRVWRSPSLDAAFQLDATGTFTEFNWTAGPTNPDTGFFQVESRPMNDDALFATTLLHRLGYGPTPDELERVRAIGSAAYLAEQLAPEAIAEDLDVVDATPRWRKVTITGTSSSSRLYIYLTGAGDAYLDNVRLVAGATDNGTQSNVLKNGDFETGLSPNWIVSPNLATSAVTTDYAQNGEASLHLVATEGGSTQASSIYQTITPSLPGDQTYTLTYWYRTSDQNNELVIRLSGSGITSTEHLSGSPNSPGPLYTSLVRGDADLADLRAWHVLHAIQSKRQLLEVTRQFLENHFVTQVTKTRDYFDNRGYDGTVSEQLAVRTEFTENRRWREALLQPNVTFLDLLKISAESPAMIVYLDTVSSRGDGTRIANENYARELCELFCFGVDNGYDQQDIVQLSRAWTGWTLELVAPANEFNPFAPRSTDYVDPTLTGTALTANPNVRGVWAFNFRSSRHATGAKYLFYQSKADGTVDATRPKTVPARFGAPWAGKSYALTIPSGRTGTNGVKDGYDIVTHMANQPFTMEYLSVKLCRLFVHDGFAHGYDFTDGESTPEEALVHQCMVAWDATNPKGQLREVLKVIFNSELFRSHAGSLQKVKTPLEFAVGSIRALRSRNDDGSHTADTDGFALYNLMNRAGRMRLFDRAEPDGYPEDAPAWISAGTLTDRIRFVQSALMPLGMSGKDDAGTATTTDPLGLLRKKLAAAQLTDATAVADYAVSLLFPAEGRANLGRYRDLAMQFLNTADNGVTASAFSSLQVGSAAHDQRIRGMFAFLMSTQRFQEQ